MSSLLPPGFCFRPSEDQLLSYYLTNKNRTGGGAAAAARTNGYDFIRELDLYEYHPCELPETSCYDYCCNGPRRRHWYCYAEVRALAEGRRRAKGGFWVMTGKAKSVCGPEGGASIGTRTEFVYYSGESATSAVKTGWVLYEYALVDHFQASYVLCRVFFKSRFGNSVSEKVLSPSAEEIAPALLGESLYPLVEQLEHDSAAKVTGMLLEMDQTEVLHLLESPDALKAKVAEAMNVLRSAAAQQQANNNADQLAWLSLNDSLVT